VTLKARSGFDPFSQLTHSTGSKRSPPGYFVPQAKAAAVAAAYNNTFCLRFQDKNVKNIVRAPNCITIESGAIHRE
jgi:hypothetical protein